MRELAIFGYLLILGLYISAVIFIIKVLSYRENRDNFLSIIGILIIILGAIALSILWYYGYPIINKSL